MIPKNLSLVPFDPVLRAVAVASNAKGTGQYRYATAFFKAVLGYSRPKAQDLTWLLERPTDIRGLEGHSVDKYLYALHLLIESQGYYLCSPLKGNVRRRLYPCFAESQKGRLKNRCDMEFERDCRVQAKREAAAQAMRETLLDELWLDLRDLSDFVIASDFLSSLVEKEIDDRVIRGLCEKWFDEYFECSMSFYDLYRDYETSKVILDFRLEGLDKP